MSLPLVTINIVVLNGEKYIRQCLGGVRTQTYKNLEVNILDNGSSDRTREIVKKEFPEFNLIEFDRNYGMWGGQEKSFNEHTNGKYFMALSVDVILDPQAVEESVKNFSRDKKIGAIEPKILRFYLEEESDKIIKTDIIDTCGFAVFRSRRVINIGHGEKDRGQFDFESEIFAVEGAAPIFRSEAFEDCRLINVPRYKDFNFGQRGEIMDHDMFWYGDDIDLGWRMHLFGWKQIYSSKVLAFHDRKTTHSLRKTWTDFIKNRKKVPILKRRLDYRNSRLSLIKNEHIINFTKDIFHFLRREIPLWGYFIIFETSMLLEIFIIIKLLPRMLKKRKEVMKKSIVSSKKIRKWFIL